MSNRVNRLAEFSKAVADGQFAQPVLPRSGDDELNVLEQNLRDMSLRIRDTIKELRSEKEKVDSILRCMVEGLVVIDPKGKVLLINDQAKTMFGVTDEQIRDGSFVEISRSPAMRTILREVLAFDFSNDTYSKRISLEDGRWFRVNAVSLRNGTERPSGSILVFHDITEIQRLETVRSDFVANVSHELRTPLTAIRGYVETLLHSPPPDPVDTKQFLTIIDRHSERLEPVDRGSSHPVGSRIRHAKNDASSRWKRGSSFSGYWRFSGTGQRRKNVNLSYSVASGLPSILGDYDRLQQLFINLVDNAVKYTPPGARSRSRLHPPIPSAEADPEIEIAVADTGAGISEKDLPRLTERFYRVDKARSRELGGTGLGLAIVKHIVQAHGGELKIESAINKGTTVRVFLPARRRPKESGSQPCFFCSGNSCRSQMAEGFARHLAGDVHRVYSAGTAPKQIHPVAIQVMKEVGIDISGQHSKGMESIPSNEIERIITLCAESAEDCPTLPKRVEHIHWPLRDPALAQGTQEEILRSFREVRNQIRERVEKLFAVPAFTRPAHRPPSTRQFCIDSVIFR